MHLPDRVDLVIVEFDTEDPQFVSSPLSCSYSSSHPHSYSDATTLSTTDLLIRSLLLRPDQPAVIMLGHFSPQIQGEHSYAGPEVWHSAVAQFYDVVHLSFVPLPFFPSRAELIFPFLPFLASRVFSTRNT
jgi:hypothetical protein